MPIPTWSGAIAITAYLLGKVSPLRAASETRPFRSNHKMLWSVGGRTTRSGVITAPELHERQLSPGCEAAGQRAFAIVCKCARVHLGASPASPEAHLGASPASPEAHLGASPASPEGHLGASPASPEGHNGVLRRPRRPPWGGSSSGGDGPPARRA